MSNWTDFLDLYDIGRGYAADLAEHLKWKGHIPVPKSLRALLENDPAAEETVSAGVAGEPLWDPYRPEDDVRTGTLSLMGVLFHVRMIRVDKNDPRIAVDPDYQLELYSIREFDAVEESDEHQLVDDEWFMYLIPFHK